MATFSPGLGRDAGPRLSVPTFVATTAIACAVFAAYAGSFLYFFVDDEAIPLVYARNLLRGRGLVYTSLEGRVEGYSDFLHVLWSAAVLAITRALGWPGLAPLIVGKGVSLIAGFIVIVLTARMLRRSGASPAGLAAGLGFLALAGPLAVWSASSLEAVVFAATVAAFAFAVARGARDGAVILGIVVLLLRIDGAVYAAVVLAACLAGEPRRWREQAGIVWPLAVVLVAYQVWRIIYFGSVLTAPLAAKILHRLTGSGHDIVKAPDVLYVLGFLHLYGLVAGAAFAVASIAAWRHAAGRMAVVVVVLLGIYVDIVDDWMFGYRFMVALLPFAALVIGLAISRLPRRAAWVAAAGVVLWSGFAASRFLASYQEAEHRPIFWAHRSAGSPAWLGRYDAVIAASRTFMHAGDRISYNQAGLLAYLLDLENIDDLGICSEFVARLPTRDVYFTGVGRYSPLTNDAVLHTAHQYLLYQGVQFIISPMDLLRKANHDRVPDRLLDGAFERAAVDAQGDNVIYRRTGAATASYRTDPATFTENVAHTSYVLAGGFDGQALTSAELGPKLPFLRERDGTYAFTGHMQIDVTFGLHDEDVSSFYIAGLTARAPGQLTLTVFGETPGPVLHRTIAFGAGSQRVLETLPAGTRGRSLLLLFEADGPDRVTLSDMRLEGQSAALHAYVRRMLRFPPG
jgi:hypothetical protein